MTRVILQPTKHGWIAYDDDVDRLGVGESQVEALASYGESLIGFAETLAANEQRLGKHAARHLACLEDDAVIDRTPEG